MEKETTVLPETFKFFKFLPPFIYYAISVTNKT